MRRTVWGTTAVAIAFLIGGVSEAQADTETFLVDTTSDSGALTTCGVPAGDCSLRGAFANANDGDTTDQDSIIFASTIFDGVEAVLGEATITLATPLASDEPLDVTANCAVVQPCVNIDGPNADNAIDVTNGTFAMDDVALYGTGGQAIFYGGAGDGLTLRNNHFGLKFDGTSQGNNIGVSVIGPNADIGVIDQGGNVIAGNGIGLQVFGGATTDVNVHDNLFGVKADGTLAANLTVDIDIAGNGSNEGPTDVRIGGNPNATPECDEGCNVIAATGSGTLPTGIDLSSTANFGNTSTASGVEIEFNFIGLNEAGTASTGATGTLIAVGAADNVVVANNRMAGGRSAVLAGPNAETVNIESNTIGLNAGGGDVLDGTSNTAININSANDTNPITVVQNTIGMDAAAAAVGVLGTGGEVNDNQIGLPSVTDSGGLTGITAGQASGVTVFANSIANTTANAIDLLDTDNSEVAANHIGVEGPIGGIGVLVTDSILDATGNTIGGTLTGNANTFGQVGDDAIRIQNTGNNQNAIQANLGGPVGSGTFIDLQGTNGPGNGGPNAGIEKPKVQKITEKAISGAAEPGGKVWVYRACSVAGVFPDCLKKFLGSKTVKPEGTWKLTPPTGSVKKSWVITANQVDEDGNGSELTKGKKRK